MGLWYVCVLHCESNFSLAQAMDGRMMHHSIISSCQSAAGSKIVKELLVTSLTHVSSAIASTQPLPLLSNKILNNS